MGDDAFGDNTLCRHEMGLFAFYAVNTTVKIDVGHLGNLFPV